MRFVLVLALLATNVARADDFGGWTYTPPAGAKKTTRSTQETGDHVTLTKFSGKTFCQYVLFATRAQATNDLQFEWENVVVKNFTVKTAAQPVTKKTKNLSYTATTAALIDKKGNAWAATHFFVQAGNIVSTVMLTASNAATLAKCPSAAFLDALALAAPVAADAAPAANLVAGVWGTSASAYNNGMSLGYQSRRYLFGPDGTYTWHYESWGGHTRATSYVVMHETGAYTLAGTKLSLVPKASTQTAIEKDKQQVTKRALEKTTYMVQKVFMEGIQKNYLVLSIDKPTSRDGAFTENARYPSSYLLEENPLIEWKYPSDK
jgi:hypothetical protein